MAHQIQFSGQTTTAVAKELFQIDGTRFSIPSNSSFTIHGTVIAQNATTYVTREWVFDILIKNVAGTVSFVGYPTVTDLSGDTGTDVWVFTPSADNTNKALGITVTGATSTTINWRIGFDFESIGYTAPAETATSSLNVPQIIDLVKLHHTKIPNGVIVKMLSTAQKRFIRETKLNAEVSTILLTGQTVIGTTKSSPLTLTDIASEYSWSFYKDATVGTLTLKASSNVIFYTGISCYSGGELVSIYSVTFNNDGSISFYDTDGNILTNFDLGATYLTIEFIKNPDALSMSSACTPEILSEYHEALSAYVISELYMTRTDIQMIERLQASKHYKNIYDEYELKAKFAYNMQNHTFSIVSQSEDFGE